MAATATAVLEQINGSSFATAYPQVGGIAQNIDLLQIVDEGGNVLLNVDYAGVVHNPASGNTGNNTRIGQFLTRRTSGTTAQLFADAFTNPSQQDILQVISPSGGSVAAYIDYLGVKH
jgi:hypothetical protein